MTNRTEILDFLIRNKNFLKKKYNLTKTGLFGSFARGEEKEDSDIDICRERYIKPHFKKEILNETIYA